MDIDKLTEALTDAGGLAFFRSLHSLGILGNANQRAAFANENGDLLRPDSILEWVPKVSKNELVYERKGGFRCKPKTIRPKHPGIIRVCLFGESMAAGFPLAPGYTPAYVLEDLLSKIEAEKAPHGDRVPFEVIDLAVPNMGPSEQLRVCKTAQQLEPDVCVFMGGNNWYYGLSVEPTASPETRVNYARYMNGCGPRQLASVFQEQLTERAKVMVQTLVTYANAGGAASIVVIPAANHHWERRTPIPWLKDEATRTWHAHLEKAERFLLEKDYDAAVGEADRMLELEQTLTGVPERIKVKAYLATGQRQAARHAAVRAIDACNWQNYTWALPCVPSYVAKAMTAAARACECLLIDMETVLTEHTKDPFLDFRMFYDQCHLTEEGVRVVMSAVAATVRNLFSKNPSKKKWPALVAAADTPRKMIAASARFQVAHWLSQFYPGTASSDLAQRLNDLLASTVSMNDRFIDVIKDQVRLRSIFCSPGLNAAATNAARGPGMTASFLSNRLNAPFLTALINVLKACSNGGVDEIFDHIIESYQARMVEGIDLVEPRFRDWFWECTPTAWHDPMERHGSPFFRAFWPQSHFSFLCSARSNIHFCLSARSKFAESGTADDQPLIVTVNGNEVATCALDPKWQQYRGRISRRRLVQGHNQVCLHWPMPEFHEEKAIQQVISEFSIGAAADMFPIFGEVYSLTLRIDP